jgi:hypothetical protein
MSDHVKSTSEKTLINEIQLRLSALGARLFRNNVGQAWQGRVQKFTRPKTVTVGPNDVLLRNARPVRFGLCTGSSDTIGWRPVVITPEMVGQTVAVFMALEVKTKGVATTKEQQSFIQAVNKSGGIAAVVTSVNEAAEIIGGV